MNAIADESGQTLIFVALALTCVLGFVGLATDVSSMLHDKRIVQTAADTAALAGATEYLYVSTVPSDVQKAGTDATQADGITNGTNGTVTINVPPVNGPHAGAAGYVEAIVQKVDHRYFLGLVGASTATVAARAVAWTGAPSTACFYVLQSPTAFPAVQLTGSYNVGVPDCGMIDDSTADPAMSITGKSNNSYLNAKYVGVVGSVSGTVRNGATPVSGVVPVSDPLAGILPVYSCTATACTETLPSGKSSAGPTCAAAPTASGSTWGPATPDGAVCYTNTTIPGNITMNPGTYIFTASSVSLGGNTGITADAGITFYFTTGSLTMKGTPGIVITPPGAASGNPFAGIAYVQAPGDTSTLQMNGDSSGLFNGTIYAPDAELEIIGNDTINLPELIVGTFNDTGNATVNITQAGPAGSNPIKSVVLVE